MRRTLLLRPNALHDHEDLGIEDLVATVNEVLQGHQTREWLAFTKAEWLGVHVTIIAVLMEHQVATSIAFWEKRHKQGRSSTGQRAALAVTDYAQGQRKTTLSRRAKTYCGSSRLIPASRV